MVDFASYKNNIPQIKVPSLVNYEAQQEENMWNQASKTLSTVSNFVNEEMAYKAKEKAKEQAVLDVEAGATPNQFPKENTIYAEQYRDSATSAYLAQLNIDSTNKLNQLQIDHKESPETLKIKQNAYIKGTVENLPAPLRPEVNKSLSLKAASDYSSVLSAYTTKQERINSEVRMVNLQNIKENILNTPEPQNEIEAAALAQEKGKLILAMDNAVKHGDITAKEYKFHVDELEEGLAGSAILTGMRQVKADDLGKFQDSILDGNTGNPYIDRLPIEKRQDVLMKIVNKQSQVDAYSRAAEKEKLENMKLENANKYLERRKFLELNWKNMLPEERSSYIEDMRINAPSDKELKEISVLQKNYIDDVKTPYETKQFINDRYLDGDLEHEDIKVFAERGLISVNDQMSWHNKLNSYSNLLIRSLPFRAGADQVAAEYPTQISPADKYSNPNIVDSRKAKQLYTSYMVGKINSGEITTIDQLNAEKLNAVNYVHSIQPPINFTNINGEEITGNSKEVAYASENNPSVKTAFDNINVFYTNAKKDGTLTSKLLAEKIRKNSNNLKPEEQGLLAQRLKDYGILSK